MVSLGACSEDEAFVPPIDENGTKVVVASSVQTMYTSSLSEPPKQIIVNRPFLFEIVAYNQIIAAGRVMKL